MSEVLEVIATIQAQEGRGADLAAVVASYVDAVRDEPGCLRYDLYGVRRDPDAFVMVERWASKDDLRAHGASTAFVAMSAQMADLVAGPPGVRVLDPVAVVGEAS